MIDYTDIVRKAGIAATSDQWGNVSYRTPDGWTVVAFYDCGEFDYIDSIISPDGIITDFDDLPPNLGIEE